MEDSATQLLYSDAVLSVFVTTLDTEDIRIAVVVLDRRTEAVDLNIIDVQFAHSIAKSVTALRLLADKGEIDFVVFCSAKTVFLAGADVKHEIHLTDFESAQSDCGKLHSILCSLESLPVPTICILNGATLGGGLELALACDYRIADLTTCTQIGLPEVKLGVLPGAGGCVRLPRLIHMKAAIQMIVTGMVVDSRKALKLGIVDVLFKSTTTATLGDDGMMLGWMKELVQCVQRGRIGKRAFLLDRQTKPHSSDSLSELTSKIFSWGPERNDELLHISWSMCEEKFVKKYKSSYLQSNPLVLGILFSLAKRSVQSSLGNTLPAPYKCLETTAKCIQCATLQEAVKESAKGFAQLATTTESKCLMGLFLQAKTVKHKSERCYFSGDSDQISSIEKDNMCAVVPLSSDWVFGGCLVQAVLYAGVRVVLVTDSPSDDGLPDKWRLQIVQEFKYAVTKGRLSQEEVNHLIKEKLSCIRNDHFIEKCKDLPSSVFILVPPKQQLDLELPRSDKQSVTVIHCADSPGEVTDDGVYAGTGTPLRRTTQLVQLYCTENTPTEAVRKTASFFSNINKLPMFTNRHGVNVEAKLNVAFWINIALFCQEVGLNGRELDTIAKQYVGFRMGPFEAMEEIGYSYVADMLRVSGDEGAPEDHRKCVLRQLQSFTKQEKLHKTLLKAYASKDIGRFLLLTAVDAALRVSNLAMVEDADVDLMSVLGVMKFPPHEGGPLCYLHRNGITHTRELAARITRCVSGAPLLQVLKEVDDDKYKKNAKVTGKNEFEWQQLYNLGPCRGAQGPPELPSIPWHPIVLVLCAIILYIFLQTSFLEKQIL